MSARYFAFEQCGEIVVATLFNPSRFQWISSPVSLILKSATAPANPQPPQVAELACQSGERLGNSLVHNSFTHTDGEILIN